MSDVLQAESENLETINKQIEHKTCICPAHLEDLKVQGDDLWKQKPGVCTCISFLPCVPCFCTDDKRQLQPTHRDTETSGASLPLCSWEWDSITPGFFCGSQPKDRNLCLSLTSSHSISWPPNYPDKMPCSYLLLCQKPQEQNYCFD